MWLCEEEGEVFTIFNFNGVFQTYFNILFLDSGLAKPSPVIETFCSDELLARHVKLDGVVTMVDSKHVKRHLNEVKARWVVNEAVEQVAYADRIILNKVNIPNYEIDKHVSYNYFN